MTRNLAMLGIVLALATWGRAVPAPASAPTTERERWAVDFLAGLGKAQPSAETVAMVVEWTIAEDSGDGAFLRNNPLNTTQSGFEETQVINSDGVRGYASREAGLQAALHTVTNGLYNDVVAALQANDPEGARQALWRSPWAGSHYGYGSGWPRYDKPRVSLPSACPVDPCWQSGTGYVPSHPGVDLGATMGQAVYATMDGVVTTSNTWPCGNGVSVTNGNTMTLACHLSAFSVADGTRVRAGDQIGAAGSSGLSTGVHVHYEIRVDGQNIDPTGVVR
jgi:murein DD-endopeptidase MepM/ murein hydrolase activator NlpD